MKNATVALFLFISILKWRGKGLSAEVNTLHCGKSFLNTPYEGENTDIKYFLPVFRSSFICK